MKYPLRDERGNFLFLNLFKMDPIILALMVSILLMLYGFSVMVEPLQEISEDPCGFCGREDVQNYCGQASNFENIIMPTRPLPNITFN